jgi:hypothetical protein
MQKLVEGKLYDTEKAEEVATWSNGSTTDFWYSKETLYQTPNGNFFLKGRGGPQSKYAQPAPGAGHTGGKELRVVSEEKAFRLLQRNNKIEAAKTHFPKQVEPA